MLINVNILELCLDLLLTIGYREDATYLICLLIRDGLWNEHCHVYICNTIACWRHLLVHNKLFWLSSKFGFLEIGRCWPFDWDCVQITSKLANQFELECANLEN